ncbi:MAG TPA: MarR family transcriptional regulator [Aliidongia sp.]|nr:MarR family transcriptional regulator [Aliidongia sp.]
MIAAEHPTLGFLLHDVARVLRKRFEQLARAKHLGLTRSQAAVLLRLVLQEGINQVTLAQLLELEPITLVRLLDRLQTAGLIERRADPQDRRARVLYLTPQARPLLDRIRKLAEEVREEAMTGLDQEQRAVLLGALATMKTNLLDRLSDQPETEPPVLLEEIAHG